MDEEEKREEARDVRGEGRERSVGVCWGGAILGGKLRSH